MKLLIIEHEKDTTAGTTLNWAKERGINIDTWRPADNTAPPSPADYGGIVICGGSMDTHEEQKHPWLRHEKIYLVELIRQRSKVFGICLGSQLLAEVLGGKVYQRPDWEIGFLPVEDISGEKIRVFQWHRYNFELPPVAELFMFGDYCRNQAYRVGKNIVATQFHPEATEDWVRTCSTELESRHTGNVQSAAQMLESMPLQKSLQAWYYRQLDQLFLGK
ncbi:MAG: type 1 glutamine amidotransferase [Bdellovibrionaceae bacterium]|nr:type 1 glutamine amidotransferase [Pseudobdellovibrionaceae bacterium]